MASTGGARGTPLPSNRLLRRRDVESEALGAVPQAVRDDSPGVVFVTGMLGAGKTTVAHALARCFTRGAHIEEDWVWWWLTMSGAVGDGDDEHFKRERGRVFMRHIASLVDNFADEGFVPIVDGAIMRRAWLEDRVARMQTRPAHLVVLAPSDDTAKTRDVARSGITFANTLRDEFGSVGLWLESDRRKLDETVTAILDGLESAVIERR